MWTPCIINLVRAHQNVYNWYKICCIFKLASSTPRSNLLTSPNIVKICYLVNLLKTENLTLAQDRCAVVLFEKSVWKAESVLMCAIKELRSALSQPLCGWRDVRVCSTNAWLRGHPFVSQRSNEKVGFWPTYILQVQLCSCKVKCNETSFC